MIDEFHPKLSSPADGGISNFKLTDAQLIIARMYRCTSWNELRERVGVRRKLSFSPRDGRGPSAADRFVTLACNDYSNKGPSPADRIDEATQILRADASLGTASLEALAVVGDHEGLGRALDADGLAAQGLMSTLVNNQRGPNEWPLILYATYSRVDAGQTSSSALDTVGLLLDRGADANAGFLWQGLVPPFTALTGTFGNGERHEPRHPDRLAIARLLLEAGADPNDGQTLYNNGIGGDEHDDPSHLELLLEFGLGTDQGGPWYAQMAAELLSPAALLEHELEASCARNRPNVLRVLIALGLPLDRPIGRFGATPAAVGRHNSHDDVLKILAEAGVDISAE